jgi:hypothetical protein
MPSLMKGQNLVKIEVIPHDEDGTFVPGRPDLKANVDSTKYHRWIAS